MLDPVRPIKGRGATQYLPNRFDQIAYVRDPDADDAEEPLPRTQFLRDTSKTVISTNDSPDVPYSATLNPYRGCEHGCIYCYARPTHEYLGFSPGLDFETKIMVKEDAPELLREAFSKTSWVPQPVSLSGVTDPYQPIERTLRITRGCLEVFAEFRNPVGIVTKNRLVVRDIDILSELARHDAAMVMVSVTTLDVSLNRIMEPRTSLPRQRIDAIAALADAQVPVGVLMAPIVPGLTDEEIPGVLQAAAAAGARWAGYIALKLPMAVAPLFEAWLTEHLPLKKEKILNRIRSIRGGRLNDSRFGSRMRGEGFHADHIEQFWRIACAKAGLNRSRFELSAAAFRRPPANGQLALFD